MIAQGLLTIKSLQPLSLTSLLNLISWFVSSTFATYYIYNLVEGHVIYMVFLLEAAFVSKNRSQLLMNNLLLPDAEQAAPAWSLS